MLLHHHYHSGHGFGSFFAKLFSKVAGKTVAKSIGTVAKVVGRKAIKAATSSTVKSLAKKAAKEIGKEAAKAGTDFAVNKINSLAQIAIKRGVPSKLVHNALTVGEEGARSGITKLGDTAVNKIHAGIDNLKKRKSSTAFIEPIKKKKKSLSSRIFEA